MFDLSSVKGSSKGMPACVLWLPSSLSTIHGKQILATLCKALGKRQWHTLMVPISSQISSGAPRAALQEQLILQHLFNHPPGLALFQSVTHRNLQDLMGWREASMVEMGKSLSVLVPSGCRSQSMDKLAFGIPPLRFTSACSQISGECRAMEVSGMLCLCTACLWALISGLNFELLLH